MGQVTSSSLVERKPRILLDSLRGEYLPRPLYLFDPTDYSWLTGQLMASKYVAIDFETTGLDYHSAEFRVVGVGFAWNNGRAYIPIRPDDLDQHNFICYILASHTGLVAHNAYFDVGCAAKFISSPKFLYCTQLLFAYLGNEGYLDNSWGLKHVMTDLLGWTETNETELDRWLCLNGFYKGVRIKPDTDFERLTRFTEGRLRPDKGQMWNAPADILGYYCGLDAEATWLFLTKLLLPTLQQFTDLYKVVQDAMLEIHLHVEQRLIGIPVNIEGLQARFENVSDELVDIEQELISHPEVVEYIGEFEKTLVAKVFAKEPKKFNNDGGLSKTWAKWDVKRLKAEEGKDRRTRFNLASNLHLQDVLYHRSGNKVKGITDSGQPSTASRYLRSMGEAGKLLVRFKELKKELGYLVKYQELSLVDSKLHPSFRMPGTCTGRLSGSNPNFQQVPKTKALLSLFTARSGYLLVDLDFVALESVLAAEFSGDKNLRFLYDGSQGFNDVHLFVGAHIPGALGDEIRRTGYTPFDCTEEIVRRAKQEAKHVRSIAKTVVYAAQFGASANKIRATLDADGIEISEQEAKELHATYWSVFEGVQKFQRELQMQWRENGGYILNGLGRPMCVPDLFRKDLLSRFIQSTGHDILLKYIHILTDNLTDAKLEWYPYLLDMHDATTVEVREDQVELAVQVFKSSLDQLNTELSGELKIRGEPTVGWTLAEVKEPSE